MRRRFRVVVDDHDSVTFKTYEAVEVLLRWCLFLGSSLKVEVCDSEEECDIDE